MAGAKAGSAELMKFIRSLDKDGREMDERIKYLEDAYKKARGTSQKRGRKIGAMIWENSRLKRRVAGLLEDLEVASSRIFEFRDMTKKINVLLNQTIGIMEAVAEEKEDVIKTVFGDMIDIMKEVIETTAVKTTGVGTDELHCQGNPGPPKTMEDTIKRS